MKRLPPTRWILPSAIALGLVLPVKAEDVTIPADLGPMLEHAAIVEEMVRACGHTRSDLSNDLSAAWQAWLRRNGRVNSALETTKHLAGTPAGDTIIYLFHSLQTGLEDRTKSLDETGTAQSAARCNGVLADLRSGHLDYRPSGPQK